MPMPVKESRIKNVWFAEKDFTLHGERIRANSILAFDEDKELVVCQNLPRNYKGKNPLVTTMRYDRDFKRWEYCQERNKLTALMFGAYKLGGFKKVRTSLSEQLQRGDGTFTPVTRKKASQGVRVFNEDQQVTDYETVKGRTEAYWYYKGVV